MHDLCADSEDELGCNGQALPMVVGSKVGKPRLFHHLYVLSLHVYTHTHTHTHTPPQPLFKHSICKATHWTETFIATDSQSFSLPR